MSVGLILFLVLSLMGLILIRTILVSPSNKRGNFKTEAPSSKKKYEIIRSESIKFEGVTLYRIRALRSFANVQAGDFGGYIMDESNLSHDGNCWVYNKAKVMKAGKVYENAKVMMNAVVTDNAWVFGSCTLTGSARAKGSCWIHGNALVMDKATISGKADISSSAQIKDSVMITGNVSIKKSIKLTGEIRIDTNAKIRYAN